MKLILRLLLFLILCGWSNGVHAQYDSTYYVSYDHLITSRFYFSKKYTSLKLRNTRENYNATFRPNTTLNRVSVQLISSLPLISLMALAF